jgi:cytochrome bd-type quinol oxidase subunit 1
MEVLGAFLLESVFLGLWLFGWDVLSRQVHLWTIWDGQAGAVYLHSGDETPLGWGCNGAGR